MNDKINLAAALATFTERWSPRTVAQLNDYDVMVVKVLAELVCAKHDDTDDFFLVLKGALDIQMRDRTVTLGPGREHIVPKRAVEALPESRRRGAPAGLTSIVAPNTGDVKTAAPRKML